jgi:transposase
MPKQVDYTLSETELKEIQTAMKHLDARVAKRATIVYTLHLGYRPEEVARMHDVTLATVYNHFQRFKSEGSAGLPDKAKRGRPTKATPVYIERLEQTLTTNPHDLGYAFTVWTQARLRTFLAQATGIAMSRSRFQDLMQQLGYRYRRPKQALGYKQDPLLREQVGAALDELKKAPKMAVSSYSLWTKASSD